MDRRTTWMGALLLAAAAGFARGEPSVTTEPAQPGYGREIQVAIAGFNQWMYLPATRFSKSGRTMRLDVEYDSAFFGPARPDYGSVTVPIGEVMPGTHEAELVLHDIARPNVAASTYRSSFTVKAPEFPGVYPVPAQPRAHQPSQAVLVGAYPVEPASVRVAIEGQIVRVSYEFSAAGGPGYAPWVPLDLPALTPGDYFMEARGTPKGGGATTVLQRAFQVQYRTAVVEFYAESTDHYFMSAGAEEIAILDRPGSGWKRTGHEFYAYLRAADAPAGLKPVCRFFAAGPNSHFYTADAGECQLLKNLESSGRAQAAKSGAAFGGWAFENIAFYVDAPVNGQCANGSRPVYRAYNKRADKNDSNHRFSADQRVYGAMAFTWAPEGTVFCAT